MTRDSSRDRDLERDAAINIEDAPAHPSLQKFRQVTGIRTTGELLHSNRAPRPGDNIGLYARVIAEERSVKVQQRLYGFLIEASFLFQIGIGASLTALGASGASHLAITILGSLNTVIAGIQTYLKGQGLPNRLQQYEYGLRKLREHIEDNERHFQHPDCTLDVDKELKEIAEMYHEVRQSAEENNPENYKAMTGAGAKLLTKSSNASAGQGLDQDASGGPNLVDIEGTVEVKDTETPNPSAKGAGESSGTEKSGKEKVPDNGVKAGESSAAGSSSNGAQPNTAGDTEKSPLLKKP